MRAVRKATAVSIETRNHSEASKPRRDDISPHIVFTMVLPVSCARYRSLKGVALELWDDSFCLSSSEVVVHWLLVLVGLCHLQGWRNRNERPCWLFLLAKFSTRSTRYLQSSNLGGLREKGRREKMTTTMTCRRLSEIRNDDTSSSLLVIHNCWNLPPKLEEYDCFQRST